MKSTTKSKSPIISVVGIEDILTYLPDYDSERSHCTGRCHDYCRCKVVTSTKINSVNLSYLISELCNQTDNEILAYCVERIIRYSGMVNPANWTVRVCGGYYGEETNGCVLADEIKNAFIQDIETLNGLSDKDRIEFVLTKEYGYVLPSIAECTFWKVVSVPKEKLILPNQDHLFYVRKMDASLIESYKEHKYARGVAIKNGDFNRLVDGYHRNAACSDKNILLVVGEKEST